MASALAPAPAQVSGHERTAARPVLPWELSFGFDASLASGDEEASCLVARTGLALEALLDSRLSLRACLPIDIRLGTPAAAKDAGLRSLASALGDPEFALSWAATLDAWRLSLEAGASLPLGPLEPGAVAGLGFPPRRAGARLSAGIGLQRCLDPLILGLSLADEAEFGCLDAGRDSVRPLSLSLGLSVTELLSRTSSVTFALSQLLEGPRIAGGRLEEGRFRYGLEVSLGLFLALEDWGMRAGVAGPSPGAFVFGFSNWLRSEYKDDLQ